MTKVTVLVAAYNAAQYIDQCLGSLVAQTYGDWEAVCVDDCSTDSTLAKLNDWASRDSRIRVLALPENSGQAHARNAALAVATGQFVCMLDADDWFSPDALQMAVSVFEDNPQTDVVLFDLSIEHSDGRSEPYAMPRFTRISGLDAFRLSLSWRIHGLNMVRATIHHRFPYDETCRLYSDDNTTRLHYMASREVRLCQGKYHYRQHQQSATHVVSVRRFDHLRANESMRRQMIEQRLPKNLVDEYETWRWLNVVDTYMFYHCHGQELAPDERRQGLNEIRRVRRTIDRRAIAHRIRRKFGYRPMPTWWLFRLQEWAYFTLRGLLGKNN